MDTNEKDQMISEEELAAEETEAEEYEDDIDLSEAKKIAAIAYHSLDEKQGQDIKIIDIHERSVLADYFIIANGNNPNHVHALMDEVEDKLAEAGYEPRNREGIDSFSWALLDYNHVIVHIFNEEARHFYNLERIWKDGIEITPEELQ